MNKKENGTIGFFDLPPATCPKATPRPPPVEASAPPMSVAPFSNKTLIIRSAFKPSKKGSLSIAIYR